MTLFAAWALPARCIWSLPRQAIQLSYAFLSFVAYLGHSLAHKNTKSQNNHYFLVGEHYANHMCPCWSKCSLMRKQGSMPCQSSNRSVTWAKRRPLCFDLRVPVRCHLFLLQRGETAISQCHLFLTQRQETTKLQCHLFLTQREETTTPQEEHSHDSNKKTSATHLHRLSLCADSCLHKQRIRQNREASATTEYKYGSVFAKRESNKKEKK